MITVRCEVSKLCPYVDERDCGYLKVTWPIDAPELHEFYERLEDLGARKMSHEDYTREVAQLAGIGARVETEWRTGNWDVFVSEYHA